MGPTGSTGSLAILIVLAVISAGIIVQLSRRQAMLPADEETTPDQTQANGTVAFLMEQQWLIRMKLAKTHRGAARATDHIHRPGRSRAPEPCLRRAGCRRNHHRPAVAAPG